MGELFDRAVKFAVEAHAGQLRKDGSIYILHPLEDAAIVGTLTQDEEVIAAAVLHDTIEDTSVTEDDILEQFGPEVAKLVAHETERSMSDMTRTESWRIRKESSLELLRDTDDIRVKILWLGDKLSNMRALARDYAKLGQDVFDRFHAKDPLLHHWYYTTIRDYLSELCDTAAFKEYCALIDCVFNDISGRVSDE